MLYFVITIFAIALLISLCTMPLAMKLARAVGLVDKPDAVRKLHDKVTPLAGGLVVFVATVLSFILVLSVWPELSWRADDAWELGALLGAGTLIFIVGLLDDRFGLRGRQKLAGQILAVTILVAFGYQVRRGGLAGFTF